VTTVIIDYGSGNLRSAEKSFQRASAETTGAAIRVSADPADIARADRVVLPGVGAFADCRRGLDAVPGMVEALAAHVAAEKPFFGICVGMQLMASVGREFGETEGFGWIPGSVQAIVPADPTLKIPHMGWNTLALGGTHPMFDGVNEGDHVYFVHGFHLTPDALAHRLATVDYGGPITAAVGTGSVFGTQFHPEKSQAVGLRIIGNFLKWRP
jgi:glutamine amidotransferase